MKLVLDTHAFLWFVLNDARLSPTARAFIEDPANDVLLSVVSVWEIAIKVSIGKLAIAQPVAIFVEEQQRINRFTALDITVAHTARVASLPHYHRDPFDRLLIAQALVEQIPIVSVDENLDAYGVQRLW